MLGILKMLRNRRFDLLMPIHDLIDMQCPQCIMFSKHTIPYVYTNLKNYFLLIHQGR